MRFVVVALAVVALAACSKKKSGPAPRCVVKVHLPDVHPDAVKARAPTCSVVVMASDNTTYAEVIAAMDTLAKVGFVDFGLANVESRLPAPTSSLVASRQTNEGMIIGRFDGLTTAPVIVVARNGDVSVGGNVVGHPDETDLIGKVTRALATLGAGEGSQNAPRAIVISANADSTYGVVYRVARGAYDAGYESFLFSLKY